MRRLKYFWLVVGIVLLPSLLHAGQIFGSISSSGKPVPNATKIEINCGGAVTQGVTAGDGSYRINVPQQGQCTLTLPQYGASTIVVSYPNPSQYDFQLVGKQLQRR
jgi:hypothetical protein